ncbi:hypothetical protein ACFL09_04710 [Planctomycetota bacterium]
MSRMPKPWGSCGSVSDVVEARCPHHQGGQCAALRKACPLLRHRETRARCGWFEDNALVRVAQAVLESYLRADSMAGPDESAIGDRPCACGAGPLPPRRRMCDECRDKARRKTKREAQRRWRRKQPAQAVRV